MEKFNLEEAVNSKFGNEALRKHFYDKKAKSKKAKGNLGTNQTTQILENFKTEYDSVEVEGKGADRQIICEGLKEVPDVRNDNRATNGAYKVPYTKNLDIVVVSVLEQGLAEKETQTISNWARDFGVITPKMHELLASRYNEEVRKEHIDNLRGNAIIGMNEDKIVDDFAQIVKELTGQVAGTLERMRKANIIEFYPVPMGGVGAGKDIELHSSVYNKIITMRKDMLEFYDVSEWFLATCKYAQKTIDFNKEFAIRLASITNENGKTLNLQYYYMAYSIVLKARKKRIIKYLEKFNKEAIEYFNKDGQKFITDNKADFRTKRKEFVVSEAEKKTEKFMESKPVQNPLQEEFGGRLNKRSPRLDDFYYDQAYYRLYIEGLYATRIGQLQEYYGHKFGEQTKENE